nr:retrovirus-related Pol polyprotein from transposon TNT 1-94 [Tanacetum cinerariifolium]
MTLLAYMLVVPAGRDGVDAVVAGATAAHDILPPIVPPTHSSSSIPGPSSAPQPTPMREPSPIREPTPVKEPTPMWEPTPRLAFTGEAIGLLWELRIFDLFSMISKRLPFENNMKRASHVLDLIHCDLWGPSPVTSIDGYHYYVIFVDDYSRFTWFYPLKAKSDFPAVFETFVCFVQTQFSRKIKIFQADEGTEFTGTSVRTLLAKNGTHHRLSCPYTPQQNGRAERKHRHLTETGLAMMFNAHRANQGVPQVPAASSQVPASVPDASSFAADVSVSAATTPEVPAAESCPADTLTASAHVSVEHYIATSTPSSSCKRRKHIAKKWVTPVVDIADNALIKFDSDNDSDDDPLPYAPYAGWEMREDPDTFALLLWGDLHVLFQSLDDEDAHDFWRNQDSWRIRSLRLYPRAQVHSLETVDGRVIYMFIDVSYPLSAATLERMLKHGLEVPKLLVGGDLPMVEQLSWLVQEQMALGKDKSNPLTVGSLLKTIWSSIHHLLTNEVLTSPEQTATGKDVSYPFMAVIVCQKPLGYFSSPMIHVPRAELVINPPGTIKQSHSTFHVSTLKKCLSDETLVIPLDKIQIDDKLHFVEEPVELKDHEVKRLKQSRIPIVKVHWNSRRGSEFTWEREDQFQKKYPHLFSKSLNAPDSTS